MRLVFPLCYEIELMIFSLVAAQVESSQWDGQQQEPPWALDHADSKVNERYHVLDRQKLHNKLS